MKSFVSATVPPFKMEAGSHHHIVDFMQAAGHRRLYLLADPILQETGQLAALKDKLTAANIEICAAGAFSGEPKLAMVNGFIEQAREFGADMVAGIGGGSAMDMAKIVAVVLSGEGPADPYLMMANPLPERTMSLVVVPTTAGTGSELCRTNILSNEKGRKCWVWGDEAKPDLVLYDPELSHSLPAHLTAWTGMDALVHAFEAGSNRYSHPSAQIYAHAALRLGMTALPKAVADGSDLQARADMLLASGWAGAAIDQVGTSIAHYISHAMAAVAPIHHGLATGLAFEATLPLICAHPTPQLEAIAAALDTDCSGLPALFTNLMNDIGIARTLPEPWADAKIDDLIRQLQAEETQSMRLATPVDITDDMIPGLAEQMLAMAG